MSNEDKLRAFVIEPDPTNGSWGMVCLTKLTEDGVWHCGINLITSIEDVIEQANNENVPIITRKYMETKMKR
jgi:hypothetical protein